MANLKLRCQDSRTNYVIKAPRSVCSELSECTDLVFIISLSSCGDPGFGSDPVSPTIPPEVAM